MSLNTAHVGTGVLLHMGEFILLHCPNVNIEFYGHEQPEFRNSKRGSVYLTSHRLVFINNKSDDSLQSFSAPFIVLNDVELEQPIFGANYIKGKVRAQPNGNFVGEVKFKLYFKAGGAIEYGQALLRAAGMAQQNMRQSGQPFDQPPPYTPSGNWHEAPPPAYEAPPGYYGWLPAHDAFSRPQPNDVFISENPPPYPGIAPPAYTPQPAYGQYAPQPAPAQYAPQPGFNAAAGYQAPGQYPGFNPATQYTPGQPAPDQNAPTNQNYYPGAPVQYPPPGQYPGYTPAQNAGGPTAPSMAPYHTSQPQSQNRNEMPSWNGFSLPPEKQ